MVAFIKYRSGYKYQLAQDYRLATKLVTSIIDQINTEFLILWPDGHLLIKAGYAWDGPSGGVPTPSFIRGSLVHDAIYQLIRERLLTVDPNRAIADKLLHDICLEDGMMKVRAWWVYKGVQWFGKPYADPTHRKPILFAPSMPLN